MKDLVGLFRKLQTLNQTSGIPEAREITKICKAFGCDRLYGNRIATDGKDVIKWKNGELTVEGMEEERRGGFRKNAGRPAGEPTKRVNVSIDEKYYAKLKEMARAENNSINATLNAILKKL